MCANYRNPQQHRRPDESRLRSILKTAHGVHEEDPSQTTMEWVAGRIVPMVFAFIAGLTAYAVLAISQAITPDAPSTLPPLIAENFPSIAGAIVYIVVLMLPKMFLGGVSRCRRGKFPLSLGMAGQLVLLAGYCAFAIFVSGGYIDLLYRFLIEEFLWCFIGISILGIIR